MAERRELNQERLKNDVLEEYVRRCKPFEADKNCELKVAEKQLEFSQQDALSLLDFDLKQADDVYRAQRQKLKCKMLEDTRRRRAIVEQRLMALNDKLKTRSNFKVEENSDDFADLKGKKLHPKLLEQQLRRAQKRTRKNFNFRHLSGGVLPTPERIVSDVIEECKKLRRSRDREEAVKRTMEEGVDPGIHITIMEHGQKLRCQTKNTHGEDADQTFEVGDAVVLISQLTEEDFFGFISEITSDEVKLVLVCGTHVRVAIARLRTGQCILHKRPKAAAIIDNVISPSGIATSLTELLQDPPDVRRRDAVLLNRLKRKTTIDIRRGF
ncbi:uncharacterized protein PHALS_04779 [Plasmopara halstedii]|uniref:Sds3-like n=1 Tax=Plasmopara halstedii TaxID=4781 RepID=A0A0P1B2F3_PLAHL|nr:uncharacterized protein PHALS_04779 [Plasmopara halstedii]CEG47629.1 hypothetical protein PHALS_04779 [Plasmopara halstedii]|eukprot:XP_024583998.1 hypothetical protein PHALS_04779 [Plasmopara halstedii]